jgi:hypothetical protein
MRYLILCLALVGCSARSTPDDGCAAACAHLRDLGCDLAKPTPNGATCEAWCSHYAATPTGVDPVCLQRATCESSETCGR